MSIDMSIDTSPRYRWSHDGTSITAAQMLDWQAIAPSHVRDVRLWVPVPTSLFWVLPGSAWQGSSPVRPAAIDEIGRPTIARQAGMESHEIRRSLDGSRPAVTWSGDTCVVEMPAAPAPGPRVHRIPHCAYPERVVPVYYAYELTWTGPRGRGGPWLVVERGTSTAYDQSSGGSLSVISDAGVIVRRAATEAAARSAAKRIPRRPGVWGAYDVVHERDVEIRSSSAPYGCMAAECSATGGAS